MFFACVLVCHCCCSDCAAPIDHRSGCQADCSRFLNDTQLGHWYGQNMMPGFPKTTAIPIGIANQHWPHGDAGELLQAARRAPAWQIRETLLYIGMDVNTHGKRSDVVAMLTKLPGAKATRERVPYVAYLQELANAKFVAAPPGNGFDTHRAWEVGSKAD